MIEEALINLYNLLGASLYGHKALTKIEVLFYAAVTTPDLPRLSSTPNGTSSFI